VITPALRQRSRRLFAIAALATVALALIAVFALEARRTEALSGTIDGHGFSLDGTVAAVPVGPVNLINLPPGGSASTPLNVVQAPLSVTSSSASVNCSGTPSGLAVTADCTSQVNNLNLTVGVTTVITATTVRAESHSIDSGSGASSNSTGTTIIGLCILQSLPGPCTPIVGPQTVPVNILGVVSGSVTVWQEVNRTMEGPVTGSGKTVTMLSINFTTAAAVSIILEIAEADSFVGGVTQSFIVNKNFVPNSGASVTVALTCTSGTVANVDTTASEADPANFTVDNFSPGTTCTATETVPTGYTANQSDCVNVPIPGDGECTIVNTLTTSQFIVNKDFGPNDLASVTITLICTSGTVSNDDPIASEADPANFTVGGFSSGATCTATETVPAGYTANEGDCLNVAIPADGVCTIVNTLNSAQFVVNKDFVPNSGATVNVTLGCSSGTVANDDPTASEADPANFTVTGFNNGAVCSAGETVPVGYSANQSDCIGVPVVADGACTIVNTQVGPTPVPTPTPSPTPVGQTPTPTPPGPPTPPVGVGGMVKLLSGPADSPQANGEGSAALVSLALMAGFTAAGIIISLGALVAGRRFRR
jgi:hypothetical protein